MDNCVLINQGSLISVTHSRNFLRVYLATYPEFTKVPRFLVSQLIKRKKNPLVTQTHVRITKMSC